MTICILGTGQLAKALHQLRPNWPVIGRSILDLTQTASIATKLDAYQPRILINTMAYTAVDRAESEPLLAEQINHIAVGALAQYCALKNIRFIHISTDYVFSGKAYRPYTTDHIPDPSSVYGQTKYRGEQAILREKDLNGCIVRTAWLYDGEHANFFRTIYRRLQTHQPLRIVFDQIGTPTTTQSLAEVLVKLSERFDLQGIFHWTLSGIASWYDFAVAIQRHHVPKSNSTLEPIRSEAYPTPAQRPAYSVLDSERLKQALQIIPTHWETALQSIVPIVQPVMMDK